MRNGHFREEEGRKEVRKEKDELLVGVIERK
jgi:hypothetical protein